MTCQFKKKKFIVNWLYFWWFSPYFGSVQLTLHSSHDFELHFSSVTVSGLNCEKVILPGKHQGHELLRRTLLIYDLQKNDLQPVAEFVIRGLRVWIPVFVGQCCVEEAPENPVLCWTQRKKLCVLCVCIYINSSSVCEMSSVVSVRNECPVGSGHSASPAAEQGPCCCLAVFTWAKQMVVSSYLCSCTPPVQRAPFFSWRLL